MTLPVRLMRRRRPELAAVTPTSIALFRLGEICQNRCPMCSNSGRPEAWLVPADELLDRAAFLASQGIRGVVLTGGEPTAHPAFWPLVARLGELGVGWDLTTHGRAFRNPALAHRARAEGLRRAIVSLHGHRDDPQHPMFGVAGAHGETVGGIASLCAAGVEVTLNCVLTRANHRELDAYVDWCAARFGSAYALKLAFPFRGGRGGAWEGIQLTYREVLPGIEAARSRAALHGIRLVFESFPNCVLGLPHHRDWGRTGFGETHYLDDLGGRTLYAMDHIEACFSGFAEEPCRGCRARPHCPGVAFAYLRTHGASELEPFGPL